MAWARRRRNGTSWTSAIVASSGAMPARRSPGARRTAVSRYAARSRRSTPTESIVPPVVMTATRGRLTCDRRRHRRGLPVRRGRRRREPRHPVDQPPDPQPFDRSQRVQRHRPQPDGGAQGDGIGARPEVLAAVVEVADAAVRDDREPEARVAQLGHDPQADGLDRPPRDRPVAVLQVRLAGVGAQAQALDGVDRRDRRAAVGRRQVRLPVVVLVRADLEDHRVAALRARRGGAPPRGSSRTGS